MKTNEPLLRSDWTIYRGGALVLEGTENCAIKNCNLTQIGSNAIFVNNYNRNAKITGNHLFHIGGSGICFVGNTKMVRNGLYVPYGPTTPEEKMDHTVGPKGNDYPAFCEASDNLIHEFGEVEKQVAGVQISVALNIRVLHNSIYDCPRSGINIGEGAFGGHEIAYNDIFNTVLETSDHGCFNSWGRDRYWMAGNKPTEEFVKKYPESIFYDMLKPNVIHDNRMRCDHGWDIDLDDGSSYYHIYNNLCLRNGIKLREGYYRKVENNICVNNAVHPHVWLENSKDIVRGNIFGSALHPIAIKHWGLMVDYNWYIKKESLVKVQKDGVDLHSFCGDPLFENPANGDFSVKTNSKVYQMGWKNFPMDQFGVQKKSLRLIAKTPEIPSLLMSNSEQSKTIDFKGGQIKNIETEGEVSATGMDGKHGVLIVKRPNEGVWKNFEITTNDVILKVNGKTVSNVEDFLKQQKIQTITIWRNQKEIIIK